MMPPSTLRSFPAFFCFLFAFSVLPLFSQTVWLPTNSLMVHEVTFLQTINTELFAGTAGMGLYKTSNEGLIWVESNEGLLDTYPLCMLQKEDRLLVGTFHGGIYESTDGGNSWQNLYQFPVIHAVLSLAASETSLFAGTSDGIYRSDDGGLTWKKATLPETSYPDPIIFEMECWEQNAVASSSGTFFVSNDNGEAWTEVVTGAEYDISAMLRAGDVLYVGDTGKGVFQSFDGGNSWTPLVAEDMDVETAGAGYITDIIALGEHLLIGASGNVFYDSISIKEGLPEPVVTCLVEHQGALYAGTPANGVFKMGVLPPQIPLQQPPGSNVNLYEKPALSVFPNPARERLAVECQLPRAAELRLELLAENGSLLQVVKLGQCEAGLVQHFWDLAGLAPGTYHVRMRSGHETLSSSFQLVR